MEEYRYLSPVLKDCLAEMEMGSPFFDAWKQGIKKIPKETGILTCDLEMLSDFGKGLGVSDLEGQLSHLELNIEMVKLRLEESRENKKRKGRLYQMLGFSLGAAVALLLV